MSDKNPQYNFNTQGLSKSAAQCMASPSIKNCVVTPIAKASLDPCFQQHLIHQGMQDPFVQHMPTDSAASAAIYSARMGGESHDMAQCDIM